MNKVAINLENIPVLSKTLSYAKQTGLRSMQNIKNSAEREIIEAYKNELTHDIWGNPKKLYEWAVKKFNELRNKDYTSLKLTDNEVKSDRNDMVKLWSDIINEDINCSNNPFLKLKILRSIVSDLKPDNAQLPPSVNRHLFSDAAYEVKKYGTSFKKAYFKLYKDLTSVPGLTIDNVSINGIKGKWYSLKVPDNVTLSRHPGAFNKIKDFISVLSHGSNWCTRSPKAVDKSFTGMDLHVFIDNKGYPQLCLAGSDKYGGRFKYIKGNNQYAPIDSKFNDILKSFLKSKKLENAVYGETDNILKPILDIYR